MAGLLITARPSCAQELPAPSAANAKTISFASLLEEMTDREVLARWPQPFYSTGQSSSYDRRSKTEPQKHPFANNDKGHFLRVEQREGRREAVLLDAQGPGAVVRMWTANPKGTLRVYLDGAAQPQIALPMKAMLSDGALIASPLAAERAQGYNLYLPIPYARSCKITNDAGPNLYYVVNTRSYAAGTRVQSFSMADLKTQSAVLNRVQGALKSPPAYAGGRMQNRSASLLPGQSAEIAWSGGPQAIRRLSVNVEAPNREAALRSTLLMMEADGQPTVGVPVGDFFGSGVGLNPFRDWWRSVESNGRMTSHWVMPFQRTSVIRLKNFGSQTVRINLEAVADAWKWDDNSMHFRANWQQEGGLQTRPPRDWNFITIRGQGIYAGDTLAVVNPLHSWWGEGDEKIYLDGESFPSHFGTGTEDYYGYAWIDNRRFEAPFHAQPRSDGSQVPENARFATSNRGHTTVTRTRGLDGIPFRSNLKFDMEIWHWASIKNLTFAATTYWYGRPGATSNLPVVPTPASLVVQGVPEMFKIPNAIECEFMEVINKSPSVTARMQARWESPAWSNELQLSVTGEKAGDFVEVRFPAPRGGPHHLALHATKSPGFGLVRVMVNGKAVGGPIDLFHPIVPLREVTGPVDLGVFEPVNGFYTLRVEVMAPTDKRPLRPRFGLDAVVATPVQP